MYATRLRAVGLIIAAFVIVLLAGLFRLQVLHGSRYLAEAQEHLKRPPGFRPTIRGTIFDRRDEPLALDTGAYDVAVYFPFIEMDPAFVTQAARKWGIAEADLRLRVERMWGDLARRTGLPQPELARRLETIRDRVAVIRRTVAQRHGRRIPVREETCGEATSIPHTLVSNVDQNTWAYLSSRARDFPGVVLLESRRREYRHGSVAPHVIGRLGEVERDELSAGQSGQDVNAPYPPGHLRRYWPGDLIGRSGAEAACEALLRGERGMYQKGLDGSFVEDIPPVEGANVHLTLDIALQSDVEALLSNPPQTPASGRVSGAAVVLDCHSGEVLALASAPRYDITTYEADFPDLLRDPAGPLVHRAIAGRYPLGSVFKAVTATAALHEGAITPDTMLTCTGILNPGHPERFRCHVFVSGGHGHGTLALHDAIKKSCNVYFYQVAELLSRDRESGRRDFRLGRERLMQWALRLGLGRATGIGLPGEAAGNLDVADPRNLAVGQGELLVTPLQAAQLYGLVATDGRMPPLRLIRERPVDPAQRAGLDLDPRLMAVVRDGFRAVVNEPGGTGYTYVRASDVLIAGKTGTAQAGEGKEDHSWFVGYAPADDPRIAFSVIVEHGGHGAEVAGPIARELVHACKAHGYFGERPEDRRTAGARPR